MSKKPTIFKVNDRYTLAWVILLISTFAITGLAAFIVAKNPNEAKDIFNVILPVFSSWVGTILAFYFGRENFESANQRVRELVEKLNPEKRAKAPVSEIMRGFREINYLLIKEG